VSVFSSEPVRPPGHWGRQQGSFRTAFAEMAEGLPRYQVFYRWWEVEEVKAGSTSMHLAANVLATFSLRKRGQRLHPPGFHVALYDYAAPTGAAPQLVFEVAAEAIRHQPEMGEGMLYGEPAPNGTLVLVTGGVAIWPVYHPRVPFKGCPTR